MFERLPIDADGTPASHDVYCCTSCGLPLFRADVKFESGTGYPSFCSAIQAHVEERFLTTHGRERTQVVCGSCGAHLGHVFADERTPTGVRYCIRHDAILR